MDRKWLYRLIALRAVPALLLGVLEGALRLFGCGYSTGFFSNLIVGGKKYVVNNESFSLRFSSSINALAGAHHDGRRKACGHLPHFHPR